MLGAPPGATIRSRLAQVLLSRSPHSGHGRSWLAGQALLVGAVCEPPCFGRFMLPRDSSTVPRFLRVRWGGDGLFTNRPYLSGSVESQLIGRLGGESSIAGAQARSNLASLLAWARRPLDLQITIPPKHPLSACARIINKSSRRFINY